MGNPNYEDVFVLAYTNNYLQVPQERRNVFDGHIMMSPLEGEQMGFHLKVNRWASMTLEQAQ
jgi:hypothetical protein